MQTKQIGELRKLWPSRQELPGVAYLNELFGPLGFRERIHLLYAYVSPEEVLATSSFGIHSSLFLYSLVKLQPRQSVTMIDTGYLFPQTLAYRELWMDQYQLEVNVVHPEPTAHAATRKERTWLQNPDRCCATNKVTPLQKARDGKWVWMSGLMAWQTPFRKDMQLFEERDGILKFHPLIDLEKSAFEGLLELLELPEHPLAREGYGSVGCTHCTVKGEGRSGRWQGQEKTECGLHWPLSASDPDQK